MSQVNVNGVDIEFESFGDDSAEPFVLVAGLGSQLVSWNPNFVQLFVDANYRVVIFDNRDVGKSSWFDEAGKANLGDSSKLAYTLDDMAADTAGLIKQVCGGRAHVVGVSLGGMVAQVVAYSYPEVVSSLGLVMTTTGASDVGQATQEAASHLFRASPANREEFIEAAWERFQTNGVSPAFPEDEDYIKSRASRAYDRAFHPAGGGRQLAAVLNHVDRTPKLADITAPTVVIHGTDDKLIDVSGGEACAKAIPNAELAIIDGMGHHIPKGAYGILAQALIENAKR